MWMGDSRWWLSWSTWPKTTSPRRSALTRALNGFYERSQTSWFKNVGDGWVPVTRLPVHTHGKMKTIWMEFEWMWWVIRTGWESYLPFRGAIWVIWEVSQPDKKNLLPENAFNPFSRKKTQKPIQWKTYGLKKSGFCLSFWLKHCPCTDFRYFHPTCLDKKWKSKMWERHRESVREKHSEMGGDYICFVAGGKWGDPPEPCYWN